MDNSTCNKRKITPEVYSDIKRRQTTTPPPTPPTTPPTTPSLAQGK